MLLRSWLAKFLPLQGSSKKSPNRRTQRTLLTVETLEDRCLPSGVAQPVSINPAGTTMGNDVSFTAAGSVSANGQYEVFTSLAENLVNGVTVNNGGKNVYLRNVSTGATTLVDVNSAGTAAANSGAQEPVISANGRYVAFVSASTNLTGNDAISNGAQIYVRDMQLDQTYLISVDGGETNGGNGSSDMPVFSVGSSQMLIAYRSNATDLTANDTSAYEQIFLTTLNLNAGAIQYNSLATTLVSADSTGNGSNGNALSPVLNQDGSTLAFNSPATDLNVPGGYYDNDPEVQNLFVYAFGSQTLSLLSGESTTTTSATGNTASTAGPGDVSSNGQYVAFSTGSDNMVTGLLNTDTYNVYRRNLSDNTTTLVSIDPTGTSGVPGGAFAVEPVMTPNGRYVAFVSDSGDLTSNTNGGEEVFVRDMTQGQTYLVSLGTDGNAANEVAETPSIAETASGKLVIAYISNATNLVNSDSYDGNTQVFVTTLNLDGSGDIEYNTLATQLASHTSTGNGANANPSGMVLSSDGSTVAFVSYATNMPGESADTSAQLFAYNIPANTLTQVSPAPGAGNTSTSYSPSISDNGHVIAYVYSFENSTGGSYGQILAWNASTGQNTVIAQTGAGAFTQLGEPFISGDGNTVAFEGSASSAFLNPDIYVASNWQSGVGLTRITNSSGLVEGTGAAWPSLSDNGQILSYDWDNVNAETNPDLFVTNLSTNATVNVCSFGEDAGLDGALPIMVSADGSTVAFIAASNPVLGIADYVDGQDNVYAYHVAGNSLSLVSEKAPGLITVDAPIEMVSLSDTGRYIAYESDASDLLGNLSGYRNVFAEDLQQDSDRVLIGVEASGAEANDAEEPVLSGDGSTVAFQSGDLDLTSINDTNSNTQIYSRDWLASSPTTTMVSVNSSDNNGGGGNAADPSISDNGQVIAFDSTAPDLTSNDANAGVYAQVFIRNSGTTTLLSSNSSSTDGGNASSLNPVLSSNGNIVIFNSAATNLVAGVTVPLPAESPPENVYANSVATANPPPVINSVVINQNISALYNATGQPSAGAQRSMVNDVVYTFSEPVNISTTDPSVFTIAVVSGWTGTVPILSWAPVAGSSDAQWAISFTGADVTGNSIANGAYTITVNHPSAITAVSDSQTLALQGSGIDSASQMFFRLFGDITGDEAVNNADNSRFKQALTTFNAAFDFNADGAVNNADNIRFKQSLSIAFTGFSATI